MRCPRCGTEVATYEKQCKYCGEINLNYVEGSELIPQEAGCWRVFAKVSHILGIITMATFWIPIFGFYSIIPGIHGIVFGALGKKSKNPVAYENAESGFNKSLVGTILSIVVFFVWIMLMSCLAQAQ